MKLVNALRNANAVVLARLEDSKLFQHHGERGEFRERVIADFLRPFLPACYGLSTGEVFSHDGQSSRQIDIIVHDALFGTVLFQDAESRLIPCESVYGSVEVKSQLTSDELKTALENVASLKRLSREDSSPADIWPTREIRPGPGIKVGTAKMNNYLSIVFGYDGVLPETAMTAVKEALESGLTSEEHLVDYIFVLKQHYMILPMKGDGTSLSPCALASKWDRLVALDTGNDTMTMLFLTLNTLLNQIMLRAPRLNDYWRLVFGEVIQDAKPLAQVMRKDA